ncbi:glycoside hydrolase [Crucibulum laeve]|uniref:beta-N-acetylhexosaminidase n=1 Tax=Crucibulum laeve TaxID=68775 RepID=A0A5C3LHF5_9AGAR|nr:glycoside hydrolase [Crucibulum laeve]
MRSFVLQTTLGFLLPLLAACLQPQIPSVKSFIQGSPTSAFRLTSRVQIIVNAPDAHTGSPSLLDFARTFKDDLISVTQFSHIPDIIIDSQPSLAQPHIFLSLGATSENLYFNGNPSREGYNFNISTRSYTITGMEPIAVWWGTRTLLQQVALVTGASHKGVIELPSGTGSDSPGWEVRGFMLDAGRHWFEASFIADLCIYASFFKIQSLHLHASDNLWNPSFLYGQDWRKLYSAFRFQPPAYSALSGIVPLRNESWSREEFTQLQTTCAAHGVALVPEIDTPGHSLVITKWKPELMIPGAPDNLNLSHPDTIPTIKSIWNEFLPWFSSLEVSIGADEYEAALADDYISFVNEMSSYISSQSGKSIRIWGTNEPSKTLSISTNVTIQHWNFPGDTIPVELTKKGYKVINSEQSFLYLDGKTSDGGQFPTELNQDLMWSGASDGGGWAPNIFSSTDSSNNTSPNDPNLRGAIMALWNDWGNNATTPLEIYYQLSRSLAVFGEKTWTGSGVQASALTRDQFDRVYPVLNAAAPGQNLNRAVQPQRGNVVYQYKTIIAPLRTSFDSVGPPYTLKFTVNPTSQDGVLFSGRDSKLHVRSLAFEDPSTQKFYWLNFTLLLNQETTVEIHATRESTYALINGQKYWWLTNLDIWGEYMQLANMSFAAPSSAIGVDGFAGRIKDVSLVLES